MLGKQATNSPHLFCQRPPPLPSADIRAAGVARQAHLACEPERAWRVSMHCSVKCVMIIATICQLPART